MFTRRYLGVSVWLCAVAATALGVSSLSADDSVKPFPVSDWIAKSFRPVFADFNSELGFKDMVGSGATAVFNAPAAPWWWDSKGFYWWTDGKKAYGDVAILKAIAERIQKAGLKAVGCIPPMAETEEMGKHPDWQWLKTPDAKPVKETKGWPPLAGCWYGPFGDYYIKKNVEMVTKLGWDGQILDGFGGTYTACYCKYCREGYLKATGKQIPPLERIPSPA